MHLVVPYAALPAATGAWLPQGLHLPQLQRLLERLSPARRLDSDPAALNLPHEHLLAASCGWSAADGRLPLAAAAAVADGLPAPPAGQGWGLLTPTHWQVGVDRVLLQDPAQLQLDATESRALMDALRSLFEPEGWQLHWGAPLRWYAVHDSLATLATASLDRVIGKSIEAWLPDRQAGRTLRRLQSEAQMLFYSHPVNDAREARGALPVNSFWLSGTGAAPDSLSAAEALQIDDRLGPAWRAGDGPAWVASWQALDAGPLAALAAHAAGGRPTRLTLCGARAAQSFDNAPVGALQRLLRRWRAPALQQVLESL